MREVSRLVLALCAERGEGTRYGGVAWGGVRASCANAAPREIAGAREAHAFRRAAWARVQVVRGRRGEVVSMARSRKEGGRVVPRTKCSSARRKVLTPREVSCGVKGRWVWCEGVAV